MRLYGEIMQKTGLQELFYPSRCHLLLGGGGYFQGVKGVSEFTPERLVLVFQGGDLELLGKGFSIVKYESGDLEIGGEIFSFAYAKRGKSGG